MVVGVTLTGMVCALRLRGRDWGLAIVSSGAFRGDEPKVGYKAVPPKNWHADSFWSTPNKYGAAGSIPHIGGKKLETTAGTTGHDCGTTRKNRVANAIKDKRQRGLLRAADKKARQPGARPARRQRELRDYRDYRFSKAPLSRIRRTNARGIQSKRPLPPQRRPRQHGVVKREPPPPLYGFRTQARSWPGVSLSQLRVLRRGQQHPGW
jgi:hypothetical protein